MAWVGRNGIVPSHEDYKFTAQEIAAAQEFCNNGGLSVAAPIILAASTEASSSPIYVFDQLNQAFQGIGVKFPIERELSEQKTLLSFLRAVEAVATENPNNGDRSDRIKLRQELARGLKLLKDLPDLIANTELKKATECLQIFTLENGVQRY